MRTKKSIPPAKANEKKNFADYLAELTGRPFAPHGAAEIEPLADYPYPEELRLKETALAEFWRTHSLPRRLLPIVPSEKSRAYRTTSKRRVLRTKGRFALVFHQAHKAKLRGDVHLSALEPAEHGEIFSAVAHWLNTHNGRYLAEMLNFVIIRGNYEQFALVLNLRRGSAPLVRKAKELGEKLRSELPALKSAALVFDDTGSGYYLPPSSPGQGAKFLFGPKEIPFGHREIRYGLPILSFSQINLSLLPRFIDTVVNEIPAEPSALLFDMYCGYGLFALAAARKVGMVRGYEGNAPAIAMAHDLAMRNHLSDKVRFIHTDINTRTIQKLPAKKTKEYFIVDPPRSGCAPGFVRALGRRKAETVVHIFCGMDIVPRELNQYLAAGYRLQKAQPLDLFPGSAALELVCVLQPG